MLEMSDWVGSDILGQSLLSVSARGSLLKSKTSQRQAAVSRAGGQALPVVSPSQWLWKSRVLGVLAPPWSASSVLGSLRQRRGPVGSPGLAQVLES